MKNIQVLLLAGGLGKRMAPLKVCKSLISFAGKPIIRYIFDDLKAAGINDFKITCNPQHLNNIKKEFSRESVKVKFYVQKQAKGMADSVLSVNDLKNQPMIVVNPEDLIQPETYSNFIKQCQKTKSRAVFAAIFKKKYYPGGYFKLTGNKITGLIEKPGETNRPSNYVKLVLDYFTDSSELVSYLKKTASSKDDVYETALNQMIKKGFDFELFKYKGYLGPLKYPWHIPEMMELIFKKRLKRKISNKGEIHKSALINGPVVIESGAKVFENAVVKGPSYIGKNTIIGTNALVRNSNVAHNCVVGYNSEIARSWIGPDCWFHNNYIGDSVLQKDVSFGSGAVTANFRLDSKEISTKKDGQKIATGRKKLGSIIGKGARVGVNASLMPGISVGSGSFVGSGIVLNKNLESNKYASLKNNNYKIIAKK